MIHLSNKIKISICAISLLLLVYIGYIFLIPNIVDIQSKAQFYGQVSELESNSDIIIKGTFKKKLKQVVKYDSEGTPYAGYTLTKIKIQKIYKSNDLYKNNEEIIVNEPYFTYTVPVGRYIINDEGYRGIEKGDSYILFLKNNSKQGEYVIIGTYQGKYLLNKNIKTETDVDNSNQKDLNLGSENLLDHYKDLYKQIIKIYKD